MFQQIIETSTYVQSFAIQEHIYLLSDRRVQVFDRAMHTKIMETQLFQKDGLARSLTMDEKYIYCSDFIHMHILDKNSLTVLVQLQLGTDASSDLCGITQDERYLYAGIRNGTIARIEKGVWQNIQFYPLSPSSMWIMKREGARIYAGNVDGQLLIIDTGSMELETQVPAHKQNLKSLCLSGDWLITASQDKSWALWDKHTWNQIGVKKNAHKKAFVLIGAWKGYLLTVSFACGEIKVWDGATLEQKKVIPIASCLSGQIWLQGSDLYLSSRAIAGIERAQMEKLCE